MKTQILFLIMLSFLQLGLLNAPLYQVITADPDILKELTPYLDTASIQGRLWLVRPKVGIPAGLMEHLRVVSGEVRSYVPKLRKEALADPNVLAVVEKVEVARIRADIETLSLQNSRLVESSGNRDAVAWAEARLKQLGYTTKQVCYQAKACSIVADKAGNEEGLRVVVAHIDSVGARRAGADDNASGTAALLEMARVLATSATGPANRFFIANGEESGLLGSKHYVQQLVDSGEIEKISLVINMDMVAYNKNGVVELETNAPFRDVAQRFAELAQAYTKLKTKITLGAWGSDHVPFLEQDVAAILTLEDWSTKTPCYHRECDKPDTLNYDYAAEITKLNVAALVTKSAK